MLPELLLDVLPELLEVLPELLTPLLLPVVSSPPPPPPPQAASRLPRNAQAMIPRFQAELNDSEFMCAFLVLRPEDVRLRRHCTRVDGVRSGDAR